MILRAINQLRDWWSGGDDSGRGLRVRRFEAAETHRLNEAHWQKAYTDQSINLDLHDWLPRLRSRAAYEALNNPIIDGVIWTYSVDVAGRNGPNLQVQSDNEAYSDALETVWAEWAKNPDARRKLGLVDFLRLWVRNLWVNGEYFAQRITSRSAAGPVSLRLKGIHPRRLTSPMLHLADPKVAMGVRLGEEGEPVAYYVSRPRMMGVYELATTEFDTIAAADAIHEFLIMEDDQVRGWPWLTSPLDSTAKLRDFDAAVLRAARHAAETAVFWYTDHPDAPFLQQNATTDIEYGQEVMGPPGWKPEMINPTQPQAQYSDYRSERQRDIGSPRGMPLMMVRHDSSRHNYSSARFDGQVYLRGIQAVQGWIERRTLVPLVEQVKREAELYAAAHPEWEHAAALRNPPKRVELTWTWPVPPHVDPQKERNAERLGLENGTLPFADACAANGTDEDTVIAKTRRTAEKFKKADLPLPAVLSGQTAKSGQAVAEEIAKQEKEEKEERDEDANNQ